MFTLLSSARPLPSIPPVTAAVAAEAEHDVLTSVAQT